MKKIFLAFIALVLLAACSALPKIGGKQATLLNTQWVLSENNLDASKNPTLMIEKERVSGNASCNNYFGQYTLDPNTGSFSVTNVGVTRMACEKMAVETHYLSMLEKANKYVLKENVLELYKDNLLLLRFRKN
ncbi:MAG: META domain-containing protein [Cloacibacterium sp.]|nr:META domain-containing protein [Cloacibacterium sp.]